MDRSGPWLEVEIKLAFDTLEQAMGRLARLPAALEKGRRLERNEVFDTPGRSLARDRRLLRLRDVDGRGVLTWKEPVASDLHAKVRTEVESDVGSPAAIRLVLGRLGFDVVYRYEKFRSDYLWEDPDTGSTLAISLDETPIGLYVELEGSKPAIDRAARRMGFGERDYILQDYRSLHADWLARRGLPAADMVFPPGGKA